jgi:secreted PhoX family phosphatase
MESPPHARPLTRRRLLKAGLAVAGTMLAQPPRRWLPAATRPALDEGGEVGFQAIPPGTADQPTVPPGYLMQTLLRWGDPILPGAPPFDSTAQSAAAQRGQFGYNNDYVGYFPLPPGSDVSDHGLLVVNHEYTSPELMFADYGLDKVTREQMEIQLAAHGLSVVEIRLQPDGAWQVVRSSPYNRRITGGTPIRLSGPAAGHPWLRTTADPGGSQVVGTLANCSGGKTPWGTVLSGEENPFRYFSGTLAGLAPADRRKVAHARYTLPDAEDSSGFAAFDPRFDVGREPNEAFRFGWVVELDPYDPSWTPRKRTALGRFKHEAATMVVAPDGRVVVYLGDDEAFEYVYKFVSARAFDPADRATNRDLLDTGTLYVARFKEDGTGDWLPLVHGRGPLVAESGLDSQAEVLINARQAADLLGATAMDRPEDVETNPVNGKVYVVLTGNSGRLPLGRLRPNAANPRAVNSAGHVLELAENGGDPAGTSFRWGIFLLCGDPRDSDTYYAGYPKDGVSAIANPDNIAFDQAGTLWIATDGQGNTLGVNDGLYAVPVDGPERGHVGQFFSAVRGAEVTGPEFTPDDTTLFVSVQHPGEGGTLDDPISTWPDGGQPRPAVLAIRAQDGGPVGRAAAGAPAPAIGPGGSADGTPPAASGEDRAVGVAAGLTLAAALTLAAFGLLRRRRHDGAAKTGP